jgi:hypothetical protein
VNARNLNRPSYVIALLLIVVALVDAGTGLTNMQSGGGDPGFVVDLGACIVSAALVALILSRPDLDSLGLVVVWSLVAFSANLLLRRTGNGVDPVATVRMAIYLITAVTAGILVAVEYDGRWIQLPARAPAPVTPAAPPAPPTPPETPAA